MDTGHLNELCRRAIQRMDADDFRGALAIAYKLKSLGPHYLVSYVCSGLLIDVGVAIEDESVVREGLELLQGDLQSIGRNKQYAPTAYYNLANGHYGLFRFAVARDPYVACFQETSLDEAKAYYRRALGYGLEDDMLRSQIWTNLGNCFDHLGRVIDALECYNEALQWKSDHGMALGNKGQALMNYSVVAGEHQGTFLIEAHSLLSRALELGLPTEAINSFSKHIANIREHFPDRQALENPPEYPGCRIETRSAFERFLIEFCLENRLYLNMCDFCQKCDAAIGDTASIKKMIVSVSTEKDRDLMKENIYLRLSAYLNQIKQDYVAARFLLILSRYKGINIDFVDEHVKIVDTGDQSVHNIRVQLVRASFRNFYDILDKIACFLDDYLQLGIPERKIDFRRLWYTKGNLLRNRIKKMKSLSLNALFDIHRDFENGPYKELRLIRNALTHRFVTVRKSQEVENWENMTEETLVRHTLDLSRVVRNAILYLLHFVYLEEDKKETAYFSPR